MGRDRGVACGRAVGVGRAVAVGVAVDVAVGVGGGVRVAVAVGVGGIVAVGVAVGVGDRVGVGVGVTVGVPKVRHSVTTTLSTRQPSLEPLVSLAMRHRSTCSKPNGRFTVAVTKPSELPLHA